MTPWTRWGTKVLAEEFPNATGTNKRINNGLQISKWLATGKTSLCQKYPGKGNAVDNYWPITCLILIRKLVTGLGISDKLLLEQKGCRKKTR